jgi:hypothetical protein
MYSSTFSSPPDSWGSQTSNSSSGVGVVVGLEKPLDVVESMAAYLSTRQACSMEETCIGDVEAIAPGAI